MSEGFTIPSDLSTDLGGMRHTPVKSRQARGPHHNSTEPKRTPRPQRPDVHYASDGAIQGSPLKHLSPPERGTVSGQPKGPRRKPKASKSYQPQYQSETDSYISQIADAPINPQPFPTTPLKQAYAGPTFHASPAASTLPMPKFFSKSVPPQPQISGLQAKSDTEDENSQPSILESRQSSVQPLSMTPIQREASPLDVFFNAQRAEHLRNQANHSPLAPSPLSVRRSSTQSPQVLPNTYPNPSYRPFQTPVRTPELSTASSKGMFMMELDGVNDQEQEDSGAAPIGITPFRDKMAAHGLTPRSSAPDHTQQDDERHRQAQSQALKRLLMTGMNNASNSYIDPSAERHHMRQASAPTGIPIASASTESRPPFNKSVSQNDHQTDIQSMENDLRRILKLEPNSK